MGANSKRRREARRARSSAGAGGASDPFGLGRPRVDPELPERVAEGLAYLLALQLGSPASGRDLELRLAQVLAAVGSPPPVLVGRVQADLVAEAVAGAIAGGWPVGDLVQACRRADDAGLRWLATSVRRLDHETTTVVRADLEAVVDLTSHDERSAGTTPALLDALALLVRLDELPLLEARAVADHVAPRVSAAPHPKLHQVRALLAKAESTEFGPEAEALMAKAQQLIARHALERLLDEPATDDRVRPGIRRVWLDRPYLAPKAALVGEVARANRCRSAFAEQVGFSIVVGEEADLDAVELLVTSLLIQADVAMFAHGRAGARGRSRSFRQSFLMAYATRIGERLATASEAATAGSDRLPVLRRREHEVEESFHAMVATRAARSVRVADGQGWRAGTAAADLSRLDAHSKIER